MLGTTAPLFAPCNSADPTQAFLTYPATIATSTIGPNQVAFNDPGLTGKLVGAFKSAAQAQGGVYGQLTTPGSCSNFVSTTNGVDVTVTACFTSSSFAYGETNENIQQIK